MDKEKVIRGLRDIDMFIAGRLGYEKAKNFLRTIDETIILLKEQEAIPPEKENDGNPGEWASWWYVCGACGREIDCHDNFCRHCGQAVKWE